MQAKTHTALTLTRRRLLRLATALTLGATSLPLLAQDSRGKPLDVYKDPTCGCCANWIDHMQQHGFASTVIHPADLNQVKAELGVQPAWQSCHTAVTEEGYVFEGHVPARHITAFLAAPPANALGLAAPGMPMGSPGMEMGGRFTPYDVLLMKRDGTASVYASIKSAADQ
jgi:hypothetical protein